MPPKKEKKAADQPPTVNEIVLKKFLQYYDAYCKETNSFTCPDIISHAKQCLEDNKTMTKIILRPMDKDTKLEEKYTKALSKAQETNDLNAIAELKAMYSVSATPPAILAEPMMKALNDVQYSACKLLYIADIPLFYLDFVQITNFINIVSNLVQKIYINDCIVDVDSIRRFASFGDAGCRELCRGLVNNTSLISLSIQYCNIGTSSGKILGEIIATTALRELFLDGNELKCQGTSDLIRTIAEHGERLAIQKELEEKIKKEEEEARRLFELANPPPKNEDGTPVATATEEPKKEDEEKGREGSGKKKKKKKKGKKKSEDPPIVGPFIKKLHIADNAIDFFEDGANMINSLNIIHETINLITKLIQYSPDIEELDIHNNTIGNMSAKMILNALETRERRGLETVAVRVSEKIDREMFDSIMKKSKKIKKKKGKKKKKK